MDMKLEIDGRDCRRVHFIGVGGSSMSGLAGILHSEGFLVTGSDDQETGVTDRLQEMGIPVAIGRSAGNIAPGTDLAVYSAAVSEDNAELKAVRERNITAIDRARLLGRLIAQYPFPICVAGTHGKTTTTTMVSEIFMAAGKDPSINLGGVIQSLGANFRVGNSPYFVVEACEYSDSFLQFFPRVGVITNIESDHLDYFRDMAHIEASFRHFAENILPGGALVIHAGIPCFERITAELPCRIITYGTESADWYAENVAYDRDGFVSFEMTGRINGVQRRVPISLRARGECNMQNALAAAAVAAEGGIPLDGIRRGLSNFLPPKRRFEIKGVVNGITIADDYAHHPTEVRAALEAAEHTRHRKLWCVFQPHTYSRTKQYLEEFSNSFEKADVVVVLDIYASREQNKGNQYQIHAQDLVDKLLLNGKKAYYAASFDEAEKFLFDHCIHGDLLITMGAGDVVLLGEKMLRT